MKDFLTRIQNEMHKQRRTRAAALGAVLALAVLSVGFHAIFEVKGVVTAKTSHSITVANFLRTQTVNLSGAPVDFSAIKTGQEVEIHKSLQGKVLSVRIAGRDHEHGTDFGEHEMKKDRH
ncbi:MAG TPA: hypothetical protein VHQ70_05105 [Syntrophomonadaceae bacterium]|nr:hypothetical protein [Syntrophomonadaceae bacterium]